MSFLDTLATAFKGGGGSRAPLGQAGFLPEWVNPYPSAPQVAPYEYSRSVKDAFLNNPVAQRAVRIAAEGVGSAPLQAIEDAQLKSLIATTSLGQSLVETLAANLLLHGNAFVQILKDASGKPVELFALRPERIKIENSRDGWPTAFLYKAGNAEATYPLVDADGWPNLIHIKAYHPSNDHFGAGCLMAAEQAVAIHNAASKWNRALLENAARPSGALVYDAGDHATLTPDQFDRLKRELTEAFSGQPNAGKPLLLEGGLKWQSLSMSPADMDFAELKAAAARDIALAFGVPPMLLGLPGDNTYSNYKEANRALWRLTLIPLAAKILRGLEEGLEPWFPNAKLAVDLDRVPALSEDRERLWSQVNDAEFLSENEKRELLGFAPIEISQTDGDSA